MKEQPQFNFKSLTPIISGKHLKYLSKTTTLHKRNQSANIVSPQLPTSAIKVQNHKSREISQSQISVVSQCMSLKHLRKHSAQDETTNKKISYTAVRKPKKLLPRPPGSAMKLAFGYGSSIVIKSVLN